MCHFIRFSAFRFFLFGSLAFVALSSPLRAQDPMAKWKPNVGDRFVCQVSHYSNCGDWKCGGVDTIVFEIIDTAYNVDNQHEEAVLAATSAIGLHLTYYVWGYGWDSSEIAHKYSDTTLVAMNKQNQIETSFSGYNLDDHTWTKIPLMQDTSVIFQDTSYPASYSTAPAAIFLPTVGWFYSLAGYQWPGACTSECTMEQWSMFLIAAIKTRSGVQSESHPNMLLLSNNGLLQFVNVPANYITLTDLLGRIIREWQFPAYYGARDITLNVADVPSGVYFLRVSAPGMEDMRKVAIAH